MAEPVFTTSKQIKVGLGDALQRLLTVELRVMNGMSKVEETDLAQRQLILDALNLTQLDLGFDCNNDGVPDNADIFEQAAHTSCCRVVHESQSCCRVPVEPADKQKKSRGKSRATPSDTAEVPSAEPVRPVLEVVAPTPLPTSPAPTPEAGASETPPAESTPKKPRKKGGFFSTLFGSNDE